VHTEHFSGKVVVITGGAKGLGRGLTEALARAGAKVVVGDIDLAAAETLCSGLSGEGLTSSAVHVDVTDAASVERLVAAAVASHGRIDYMINNAGIAAGGEFEHVPAETMRRVVEIDLLGAAYGTLSAYRQMLRQGGWRCFRTRCRRLTSRRSTASAASRARSWPRVRRTASAARLSAPATSPPTCLTQVLSLAA